MAKLVAIGDSLTQGVQSGAILRTDLSYPTLIARALGLSVPSDFRIPSFPGSGLPLNLEELLRRMVSSLGNEITGGEWFWRFPSQLGQFIDETEDLYERKQGRHDRPPRPKPSFHNLAVLGFRVADSFQIDSDYCKRVITEKEGWLEDDFLGLPSGPMYRVAQAVLNPGNQSDLGTQTQLGTLEKIQKEEGVEALILWLGANDCLGTVASLKLALMPEDFASEDPEERRTYTLTHPKVFAKDYQRMVDQIKSILDSQTPVFVATVPYVTIPPVSRGIGRLPNHREYFDYYGRFFAKDENFNSFFNRHLTGAQVQQIDQTIDAFNQTIRSEVERARGEGKNWHLVDIAAVLNSLAVKRQHLMQAPEEPLIAYYRSLGITEHPLLQLDPIPNILLLETQDRVRLKGGFFSLDGVHPTTIGYGLVAEAFLRVMQGVGVPGADPAHLNWRQIIAQDSLLQSPPVLWDDIVGAAESNATLWDIIFQAIGR